jgi:putative ABC transport system permease protein
MNSSYFKIAWRSLLKSRTYSLINIAGLALGTLCCLYILLYLRNEYSYDKQHGEGTVFRVTSTLKQKGDNGNTMATCSPPIAPAMKADFPEVKQFTRVVGTIGVSQHLLKFKDKAFFETDAVFVDSTFFDVFNWHFVAGHPAQALSAPYSVVLGKSTADKLFGDTDPVGQVIEIDNTYGKHDFTVNGVVDGAAGETHIRANIFMTMNSGGIGDFVRSNNSWSGNNFTSSYVKLDNSSSASGLEKKLPAFVQKYGADQLRASGREKILNLQPVASIHTTPGLDADGSKTVSKTFLNILLLIAIMIQVIACINFMNLSTARASKRAKEVGVRKVIGAERGQLVWQFLGESLFISIIGVLVAVPLLIFLLPYLNQITGASLGLSLFRDINVWLLLGGLALATGLVAGSYPALYLSAFNAIKVIKGNFTNQISAAGIRRSLVVFQFVLSIVLISGIIIIYNQLNYIKNKDLGFSKEQELVFSFHTDDAKKQIMPFIAELNSMSEVRATSRTNNYPSQFIFNDMSLFTEGGDAANAKSAQFIQTDEHFASTAGIKILSGRDFLQGDSEKVVVNERMLKELNIQPENAAGTFVYSMQGDEHPEKRQFQIIGVMKDINYNSLKNDLRPFMLLYNPSGNLSHVLVAVRSENYTSLLEKMQRAWAKVLPGTPFEYKFLDEEVAKQYVSERTLASIINSFTLMAILISCLGLFGLAAFNAEQRTKEIGIRKVLGANVMSLTTLLSKDFLKLVIVALIVATPIAWWAMSRWLEAFAYRISISWWMFAIAGLCAMTIAMITVSLQAIRAAISNPVKALRSE